MRYLTLFFLSALALGTPMAVFAQPAATTPQVADNFKLAKQAYKSGDYKQAIALLNQVLESDTKNINALMTRGAARYKAKDFAGAVADYTAVTKIDEKYARAYGSRGVVYFEEGDLSKAEADFTQTLKLDQDQGLIENAAAALFQRAGVFQRQGKVDEAIGDLSNVVKIDPTMTSGYLDRALLYFYKSKYSLALADWQKAAETDPKAPEALAGQAIAFYRMGQNEEASTIIKAAGILEPRYVKDIDWVRGGKENGPGWNYKAVDALKDLLARIK